MMRQLKDVVVVSLATVLVLGLVPLAHAESAESDAQPEAKAEAVTADRAPAGVTRAPARDSGEDDEYNFSWLDPDKKVYVLQNRKFRKKGRPALFLSGGMDINNPYRKSYLGIPRVGFWFTEQFGVEAFYAIASNASNSNFNALRTVSASALPFVREVRNYFGGVATYTPWYGKLNFFNMILYFDWYLMAGAGQVGTAFDRNNKAALPSDYVTENMFAYFFGTGQNFYITRNFLVRLDLLGMGFTATGPDNLTKSFTTKFDFAAGVGFLF